MTPIPTEFLAAAPKADLHVHLDGSLRLATLIELARERGVALPSADEEGLRETVFKERYANLGEYLRGFAYTCAVLRDAPAIERVAYELAVDSFAEGVRYVEPRFAPQLLITEEMEMPAILRAADRGLRRATAEFNARPDVAGGGAPGYNYGIIVCALRMFRRNFSRYYHHLLDVQAFSPEKASFRVASVEMARAAVRIRDDDGLAIVGFDLAGQEYGYPAHDHAEAYGYAHRHFLNKTVHAGEAYGAESIFEAITDLHTDRVGHGYYLFDPAKIASAAITDPEQYIRHLAEYIADRRITIEVCLTSNEQTNPELTSLADHPVRKMLAARLSTVFCTDNRLVSRTSVTRELTRAVAEVGLDRRQLKDCIIHGFKRSFMPLTYLEKREYVRRVIDYYEALERQFGII